MIGKDSKLASLFYNKEDKVVQFGENCRNSVGTKGSIQSNLTLNNLHFHEKQLQNANDKFLPKVNRLIAGNRGKANTQAYSGTFSIFDALYELESFGQL